MRCVLLTFVLLASTSLAAATSTPDRVRSLLDEGKTAEALALLEPLADRSGSAEVQRLYARALLASGRVEDAIEPAERAVELEPKVVENHLMLGNVLGSAAGQPGVGMFRQMRLAPRIREAFESAVQLDPKHLVAQQALFSFYVQAPAIAGGGHDKAARQAATIAQLDAGAGQRAQLQLAIAQEDWAASERLLGAVPESHADGARLRTTLAIAYQNKQRWADAFRILDGLVAAQPDALGAWYQIGRTAVMSGQRLEQGEAAFKRYLTGTPARGEPPLAAAHWRLGMLYERMARKADAKAQYQRALVLDPQHAEAKAALKKIG